MDETGICGRDREIRQIYNFIISNIESKKPGVLYLAGPPGTGKSMSVQYVLDKLKVPKVYLNCLKAQSSRVIASKLCGAFGLERFVKLGEPEMISRLVKKLTGRTCETHLIVLDEIDELPKSKYVDLVRTIFSWPRQPNSKLILIAIANTVNLTSRYQTVSSIVGRDDAHITKIVFRPYTSKDIRAILQWYIDNDENFEDALVEDKVLDMISMKIARASGDIRAALNALRSTIDDTCKQDCKSLEVTQYPTPPSTPPATPCLERTNLASLTNSIRKRQKTTHYMDDKFPFAHQVILTCIFKLCSKNDDSSADYKACETLVSRVLAVNGLPQCRDEYRAMLDNLELQGLIAFKKGRSNQKIVLRANENELNDLVQRKGMIMDLINTWVA